MLWLKKKWRLQSYKYKRIRCISLVVKIEMITMSKWKLIRQKKLIWMIIAKKNIWKIGKLGEFTLKLHAMFSRSKSQADTLRYVQSVWVFQQIHTEGDLHKKKKRTTHNASFEDHHDQQQQQSISGQESWSWCNKRSRLEDRQVLRKVTIDRLLSKNIWEGRNSSCV